MKSSVERDERVMAILASTLQRLPAERELYMRTACKNDEDLYREVVEAMEWEARMGSFLLEPWVEFTKLARPFQAGQIIEERFEIVREIGEGGMGIVYEAFDRKRDLKIAIKAAKLGFNVGCLRNWRDQKVVITTSAWSMKSTPPRPSTAKSTSSAWSSWMARPVSAPEGARQDAEAEALEIARQLRRTLGGPI